MGQSGNDINIAYEVDRYFNDSSIPRGIDPKFVLITGGTGAGKTTIRKKDYSKGFVLIDAGDVFKNICRGDDLDYEFGKDFRDTMQTIGLRIAERAIKEKRNIVMEIIGKDAKPVKMLIDSMLALGYKVDLKYVDCADLVESYRRHVEGAKEFVSAHFSQEFHTVWLASAMLKEIKSREGN